MGPLADHPPEQVHFMEVAPENWIGVGGRFGRRLREFTERYPFVTHGLSLSLGGPAPLDEALIHRTRRFLDAHGIRCCTEHLSYCSDDGHLYDLMPIPFTESAVRHTAQRSEKCDKDKKNKAEGKCGEGKQEKTEGKCGEGKCGGSK